jgi:DNA-directed RNA polymerase subunit RPC12/RpoP
LTEKSDDKRPIDSGDRRTYDSCPHCGQELSPWQQVLLTIDRALVCKNCWYRIILDNSQREESIPPQTDKE